jgi:1-pyrroline-5-carboxylate dehydrogenase
VPAPVNEPTRTYAPGTPHRASLKARLAALAAERTEIPLVIGGTEVRTGDIATVVVPHEHSHVLATWHKARREDVGAAIGAAMKAHREWSGWPFEARAAVFLRAAELLSTTWRDTINAATMLNQSKTAHQAEIDAACELIDFLRFNVWFAERIHEDQPCSSTGVWNRMDYRPLEGFVYAITPFNFTAIAGNLPAAPALMGNTVVWKCASSTVFSNYMVMKVFEAAGLPPGVINFVPGDAAVVSEQVLAHPDLGGIHFTGSTGVFNALWHRVGANLANYRSYPRVVGETGGKDFILAHPSADPAAVLTGIVRGGYEFQGQKCSAASRVYLPEHLWRTLRGPLCETIGGLKMGDVADFRNFMGAVIDRTAFNRLTGYLDRVRTSPDAHILAGGEADAGTGYFIRPTLIETRTPDFLTMREELFGPIVTLFVYPDREWEQALSLVDTTSPYALTGSVFATDRAAITRAEAALRYAAGNFYINDKPTGAVVGQQPFGGARASGTNDKAGSMLNLLRWISPRTVKETLVPPTDYAYPFMGDE